MEQGLQEVTKAVRGLQEVEKAAVRRVLVEERSRYCTLVACHHHHQYHHYFQSFPSFNRG